MSKFEVIIFSTSGRRFEGDIGRTRRYLIWKCEVGSESEVEKVLSCFELKKIEEGKFRFCGREYEQYEDFSLGHMQRQYREDSPKVFLQRLGREMRTAM